MAPRGRPACAEPVLRRSLFAAEVPLRRARADSSRAGKALSCPTQPYRRPQLRLFLSSSLIPLQRASGPYTSQSLDEDERNYHSLLSTQPEHRTVPPAFETLHS